MVRFLIASIVVWLVLDGSVNAEFKLSLTGYFESNFDPEELFKQTGDRSVEEANAVIAKGHPPEAEGVIMIDFDATIAPFGMLFAFPDPIEGAVEFIRGIKKLGYTVGVFTSR